MRSPLWHVSLIKNANITPLTHLAARSRPTTPTTPTNRTTPPTHTISHIIHTHNTIRAIQYNNHHITITSSSQHRRRRRRRCRVTSFVSCGFGKNDDVLRHTLNRDTPHDTTPVVKTHAHQLVYDRNNVSRHLICMYICLYLMLYSYAGFRFWAQKPSAMNEWLCGWMNSGNNTTIVSNSAVRRNWPNLEYHDDIQTTYTYIICT